jgi:hypothetical protein
MRHQAAHRRQAYQSSLEEVLREEAEALRRKHGLSSDPGSISTSSLQSSPGGMGFGLSSAGSSGGGRASAAARSESPDLDRHYGSSSGRGSSSYRK